MNTPDRYRELAALVYHVPYSDVTEEQLRAIKRTMCMYAYDCPSSHTERGLFPVATKNANDNLIYDSKDGKFIRTENAIRATPTHRTFLIICQYGDWSGFRTLAECEKQFPELERTMAENRAKDGYYQVVER